MLGVAYRGERDSGGEIYIRGGSEQARFLPRATNAPPPPRECKGRVCPRRGIERREIEIFIAAIAKSTQESSLESLVFNFATRGFFAQAIFSYRLYSSIYSQNVEISAVNLARA